ncbi:MAG: Mor transcription activator family protein [Brevinema sp.]
MRNEEIYKSYKSGSSYQDLSTEFQISERWIRVIVEIMRKRCKS